MSSLCPYKVVASIVCWSNDNVMCGQRFERVFENSTWQMRAIAVEGNRASFMRFCEVRKHRSEACRKTLSFLGNYAHFTARELRQFVYIGVRAHDGNFDGAQ